MSSKLLQKLETWMSFAAEKIESALRSYLADMHYSLTKAMSGFGLHFVGLAYSERISKSLLQIMS